jgi:hypothetical protein
VLGAGLTENADVFTLNTLNDGGVVIDDVDAAQCYRVTNSVSNSAVVTFELKANLKVKGVVVIP